ncbi:hypothetical protein DIPPA_56589 [Diplonema papillatum]|nr:hypothetical protein DIPPA_56589 [Diplonema papillatum]
MAAPGFIPPPPAEVDAEMLRLAGSMNQMVHPPLVDQNGLVLPIPDQHAFQSAQQHQQHQQHQDFSTSEPQAHADKAGAEGFAKGTVLQCGPGDLFVVPEYDPTIHRHHVYLTSDRIGMTYLHRNQRVYIVDVFRGSPTWNAGLRRELMVVAMNGEYVSENTLPKYVFDKARAKGDKLVYVDVRYPVDFVPQPIIKPQEDPFAGRPTLPPSNVKAEALLQPSAARRSHGRDDQGRRTRSPGERRKGRSAFYGNSSDSGNEGARPSAPYPTVWGYDERQRSGGKNQRVVHVDLLVDSNRDLQQALLLCGQELECRISDVRHSQEGLKEDIENVNIDARNAFGAELTTVLRSHPSHEACRWAIKRAKGIHVPTKMADGYRAAKRASRAIEARQRKDQVPLTRGRSTSSKRRGGRPSSRGKSKASLMDTSSLPVNRRSLSARKNQSRSRSKPGRRI